MDQPNSTSDLCALLLEEVGLFELGGRLGLVRWIAVATLDAPEFCDQMMAR